jgi:hypothetical protein
MRTLQRCLVTVTAVVAVTTTAACSSSEATNFSPAPSPAAIAEAKAYASQHAGDPVKYRVTADWKAKDWVRGVVLQDGLGKTRLEGPKWKGYVIWPDGTKDIIASNNNYTDEVNLIIIPGDYIAYYHPLGGALFKKAVILITPQAVPSIPTSAGVKPTPGLTPTT